MIVDDHVINCMTIRETTVQRSAEITGPRRSASFMVAVYACLELFEKTPEDISKARNRGLEFDVGKVLLIEIPAQQQAVRRRIIQARIAGRCRLNPCCGQPLRVVLAVDTARIAEVPSSLAGDGLDGTAILSDLRAHGLGAFGRQVVRMRVQPNGDAVCG